MVAVFNLHLNTLVHLCEKRTDPNKLNGVREQHAKGCLSDQKAKYQADAKAGNYESVIGAIWRDKENRLAFLRELAPELHAPLLFEQAIAEFVAAPSKETLHTVSVPLLYAAKFRLLQDLECSNTGEHLCEAADRIYTVYKKSLGIQVDKHSDTPSNADTPLKEGELFETILRSRGKEEEVLIVNKVREVGEQSKRITLPPPVWVSKIGVAPVVAVLSGKESESSLPSKMLIDPSEWQSKRDAFSDEMLEKTDKEHPKINP